MPLPTVTGLALCRPLAADRPGPPWRAKDVRSGYEVVLREVVATPGSGPLPADLIDRITRLPDHPHLMVPVLHEDVSGRLVLATRYAAHRGLDQIMSRRAGLGPGEVSTVAVAVGRALAALHGAGLVHGGIEASAVLLDAQGRVFLDATPTVVSPPSVTVTPAEDVAALSRLLLDASAEAPPALARMLQAGRTTGVIDSAGDFVRRLVSAAAPEPLRLGAPSAGGVRTASATRPGANGRRNSSRRVVLLATAAAITGVLAAGVVLARGSLSAPTAPTEKGVSTAPTAGLAKAAAAGAARPTSVDWAALLADLDNRRAEAFSSGDPAALTDVDAAGSTVLSGDQATLRELSARGLRASGFREDLRSVTVVTLTPARVLLRVADERPAYQLMRARDGGMVASWPARGVRVWQVELVLTSAGWQVNSVRPL